MSTISVDTDQLKETVTSSASASANLDEANSILIQIVEHTDWICARKDTINTEIESIRSQISRLAEDSTSFHNVINEVTEEFIEAENQINKMTESLQDVISAAGITGSTTSVSSVGSSSTSDSINVKVNK